MGVGYNIQAKAGGSAEIYIYEDVGDSWFGGVSAKQFADDLKALGAVTTLDVRINSYGGDVFDGLAIYRQLADHPARVIMHIDGIAASIASVIAMAGDEIRMAEAGFMMVHPAQGGVLGDAQAMRDMAQLLDRITASIGAVYQARTAKAADVVMGWINASAGAGTWFTATEALAQGLVDQVEPNMLLAANAQLTDHQARLTDKIQANSRSREALRPAARELDRLREAADIVGTPPAPVAAPATAEASAARPNAAAVMPRLDRLNARLTLAR